MWRCYRHWTLAYTLNSVQWRNDTYTYIWCDRFTKNNFFQEKNSTIVTFPVKNLEMKEYYHPSEESLLAMQMLPSEQDDISGVVECDGWWIRMWCSMSTYNHRTWCDHCVALCSHFTPTPIVPLTLPYTMALFFWCVIQQCLASCFSYTWYDGMVYIGWNVAALKKIITTYSTTVNHEQLGNILEKSELLAVARCLYMSSTVVYVIAAAIL